MPNVKAYWRKTTARTRDFDVPALVAAVDRLVAEPGLDARLLYLDCEDETLARRFTETRRRHPLAADRPLADGIKSERRLLEPLRARADKVIDTSALAVHPTAATSTTAVAGRSLLARRA